MTTNTASPKPRRGRPRLVDRDRIIEAARDLDPATLTMQALAQEIGVDRKTLHYHVANRESLLRMVAADAFREAVSLHDFVAEESWRAALETMARITREAVIRAGAWASYVRFETEEDLEAVRPAEAAARALIGAGLTELEAGRVVAMVAVLAFSSARDQSISESERHPQEPVLERALEHATEGQFAVVRRLVGAHAASLGSAEQFDFEVRMVVLGVEAMLAER